jgi:hypothetical protein
MSISASYGCVALVMLGLLVGAGGKDVRKARRPHFAGAAFSKTWLNELISAGVGHGATHHRRGSDDGKLRGGGSE